MWRFLIILLITGCRPTSSNTFIESQADVMDYSIQYPQRDFLLVNSDITMGHYFEAIDSLCEKVSSLYGYDIDEYILVHSNKRIIDTLMQQDYYEALLKGKYIEDQRKCIALHAGDTVFIPTQLEIDSLRTMLSQVLIDVNIPEYTLRIWVGGELRHSCLVRVGRNERRYLQLAHREVNLQTPVGKGKIVRIERNPLYINPVDGHRYTSTRRDDGRYTKLPRIPFLEPELDGRRPGSLIHPTTNRSTLGKAVSNGCVGLSEADAWMVYYYAPIGTEVEFRYDLRVTDSLRNPVTLEDIYKRSNL